MPSGAPGVVWVMTRKVLTVLSGSLLALTCPSPLFLSLPAHCGLYVDCMSLSSVCALISSSVLV